MLKPFATKLDEEVLKKLDDLAHRTQIPKSRLCRQAIDLLAEYYEQRERRLALADKDTSEEAQWPASEDPRVVSRNHF